MRANQKKREEETDQPGEGKEGKEGEWCTGEQEEWVTFDPRDPSFQIGGFSPFRPIFQRIGSRYHSQSTSRPSLFMFHPKNH
ncbi:hypothetical protein ACFX2F_015710 [Malus domestica]